MIPSEVPSNVGQRKFNELIEFPANIASEPPPQALLDALNPEILQHLVQAAAVAGAHIAACQLLSIPGNTLPESWNPPEMRGCACPEGFHHEMLPDRSGVRVTHKASGKSVVSTSEDTLYADHLKALTELQAQLQDKPKTVDEKLKAALAKLKATFEGTSEPKSPRIDQINKIVDGVFAKQGIPATPEQMHDIQKRIATLLNKLELGAVVGCILMPEGRDPEEWASLLKTFSQAQIVALKKLTDAGDQAEIQKFFEAAQAAQKAG